MNRSLSLNRGMASLLIPVVMIVLLIGVSKTAAFNANPNTLSVAITLDLLLTVPIIYFLLIRKKSIPGITVIPVFAIGIFIAELILPKGNHFLLDLAKTWVLPIVELAAITFILSKTLKMIARFKLKSSIEPDFYTALKSASKELLPSRISAVFSMEIAVFYYGLYAWKKRKLAENEFSYHRDSSASILLGVFIPVLLIETFVVHILLQGWSNIVAWIVTSLSIYTALQFFAILKSFSRRPIVIGNNAVFLKYGLFAETEIPFEKIQSIELSSGAVEFDQFTRHLSPLKELESHTVRIKLKEKHQLSGFYGMNRSFNTLVFHVDNKERFLEKLQSNL